MTSRINDYVECIYCGFFTPLKDALLVPDIDDDAEWDRLSDYHEDNCKWILTRAHIKESK